MDKDKLLLNYQTFTIIDKDSLTESIGNPDAGLIVSGVVQRANVPNQNQRIYPKDILEREVTKYKKKIQEKTALGELDHPDSSVINLLNVSHNFLDIWWKGNDLFGKIEILSTPSGNILKELFKKGIKVGISSRGFGSVNETEQHGIVEVDDDFELLCFDFVSDPSTHGAFQSPLKESKERVAINKRNKVINDLVNNIIELYNRK
jgi:hypothetical protein